MHLGITNDAKPISMETSLTHMTKGFETDELGPIFHGCASLNA